MRHEHDLMSGGVPDSDFPFLFAGMIRIGKGQRQWINEDGRRVIKRYAMLFDVGLCLDRGPLIDRRLSLPQVDPPIGPQHRAVG